MADKSPKEIERILEKAKTDDQQAKKADRVISDAYARANPQRQYRESADD